MLASVRQKWWFKDVLGVLVAYVFTLQVMLTGVVATQMAFADENSAQTSICYGLGEPGHQGPNTDHHAHHVPCAICTFASIAPIVPDATPVIAALEYEPQVFTAILAEGIGSSIYNTPKLSQGPPQTV